MSKVLIVESSWRKGSNSNNLANQVAAGAESAGHQVEVADISRLRIEPCRGCGSCLKPGATGCVVKDDMQPLYAKVKEADAIIYVSPIYWFNLCGQIKQFLDRCFAVAVQRDEKGKGLFASKKLGLVLAFGDVDAFRSGAVNAIRSLQDVSAYCGASWAGVVYASANDPNTTLPDSVLEEAKALGARL